MEKSNGAGPEDSDLSSSRFLPESQEVPLPCILRIDCQSSSSACSVCLPLSFNWLDDFAGIVAGVEFGALQQGGKNRESYRIPCNDYHRLMRLNHMIFDLGYRFSGCEPNQLMVHGEIEL